MSGIMLLQSLLRILSLFNIEWAIFLRLNDVDQIIYKIKKPSYAKASEGGGGAYRSRTDDLLTASQAL